MTNIDDYISECPFDKGDRIFIFSDGIGDNFTNDELGQIFYGRNNCKELLRLIVRRVYEIERQKGLYRGGNPYIHENPQFSNELKGARDNMSGVIIDGR